MKWPKMSGSTLPMIRSASTLTVAFTLPPPSNTFRAVHLQPAVSPPSTGSATPLMKAASSEAR